MSMSIGGATVTVVEARHGRMNCDSYPSKLEAVLQMIDYGDLGGGIGYGCDEHKAALDAVERRVAETRTKIAEMWERDARLMAEPAAPPCLQCGAMTAEEAETKCLGAAVDDCHGNRLWQDG